MNSVLDMVTRAAVWSLFHSLWIGLTLTLITSALLAIGKKWRPEVRCRILQWALSLWFLAVVAVALGILFGEWGKKDAHGGQVPVKYSEKITWSRVDGSGGISLPHHPRDSRVSLSGLFQTVWEIFFAALSGLVIYLFFGWLLPVLVKTGINTWTFFKIRKEMVPLKDPYWQGQIKSIAREQGVFKPVTLCSSTGTSSPCTFGVFKPLILLPSRFLDTYSRCEVRLILNHEMAHIRRGDFAANLMVLINETAFFFHPCIYWLNNRLREEREFCCDDLALAKSGLNKTYAHLLFQLQKAGRQHAVTRLPVMASGQLERRIRRLMEPQGETVTGQNISHTVSAMSLGLAMLLLLFSAFSEWGFTRPRDVRQSFLQAQTLHLVKSGNSKDFFLFFLHAYHHRPVPSTGKRFEFVKHRSGQVHH